MIPRYQRVLFWTLTALSVLMASYLIYLHHKNRKLADFSSDDTPIASPESATAENVTFLLANDADGSLTPTDRSVGLPANTSIRARALLEHLLADYALPDSQHKLPGGIAVEDVFLLPLPLAAKTEVQSKNPQLPSKAEDADPLTHATGELAIINLRSQWVATHPAGAEAETLTLLSIIGTLHANMPEITHIRFLVDGQQRDTLAGHVDLHRTFASTDTATTRQ